MANYLLGTSQQAGVFTYLTANVITNPYHNKTGYGTEVGIDFGMDLHTPVYALADGVVVGAEYLDCPGGVISTQCVIPLDPKSVALYKPQKAILYYQHLDVIVPAVYPGASVIKGQLIAYSGGQLSGGYHNNQPACSGGPHIEVGLNPPLGAPWNAAGLGPSVDPTNFLIWAIKGGEAGVLETITQAPGFLPIAQALQTAEMFRPLQASTIGSPFAPLNGIVANTGPALTRGIFILIGLLLIIGALQALLRPVAEEAQGLGAQALKDAALLGVAA